MPVSSPSLSLSLSLSVKPPGSPERESCGGTASRNVCGAWGLVQEGVKGVLGGIQEAGRREAAIKRP